MPGPALLYPQEMIQGTGEDTRLGTREHRSRGKEAQAFSPARAGYKRGHRGVKGGKGQPEQVQEEVQGDTTGGAMGAPLYHPFLPFCTPSLYPALCTPIS